MRKISLGTYGLALTTSLILCAVPSAADTFLFHVKMHDGTPLVGHAVSVYLEPSHVLVSSGTTDAAGDCTLDDNISGQNRCIGPATKPGYVFEYGIDPLNRGRNPICANVFIGVYEVHYWAIRENLGTVSVIGGEGGYVNPNRGETAKIISQPIGTGTVVIKIYTPRGKLVVTKSKFAPIGIQTAIDWDGKNDEGQLVPTGIYIAHVVGPGGLNTKVKIAIIKK